MAQGTVKWFNNEKKFGFIEFDQREVFVHFSAIVKEGYKTLKKGQTVEFDLETSDKGERAVNVRILAEVRFAGRACSKKPPIVFYPHAYQVRDADSAA